MHTGFLVRSSEEALALTVGSRTRRAGLLIAGAVLFLCTLGYHLYAWQAGPPDSLVAEIFYCACVVGSLTALWLWMSHLLRRRQISQTRIFWTLLIAALLSLTIGRLVTGLTAPPGLDTQVQLTFGFDVTTRAPLTLTTVLKMSFLSLLEAAFAFLFILRLRDLVLFKRTRQSLRNWYLMLGGMVLLSLLTFNNPPTQGLNLWQSIAAIPVALLMVLNALRVSWIVYLSFREKLAVIGLTALLLGVLVFGLAESEGSFLVGDFGYVPHYSYPLSLFSRLAVGFGSLYCLTAFLFVLFHLPTTVDFQRKAGELAALQSLTDLIGQVFDREKLVRTIAASPVEAGAADKAWLSLYDMRVHALRPTLAATKGIAPVDVDALLDLDALSAEVQSKGTPIFLEQAPADHRVKARPGDGIGSLVGVPLLARGEMLGVLYVAREVTHGFERDDVEAVRMFASQAALALDNARLFEEQVEKERMSRELDIAREVQRKLLPQYPPSLPGVSIAASSVSAQEVGGDYYDFAMLDAHRMAVIVADVSGKGTSAAFYMAEMQGIFQALSFISPSPSAFFHQANRAIGRALERNSFITGIYGVLDVHTETITLARAGHCPAAIASLNAPPRLLRTRGLGLGLDRGTLFDQSLGEETVNLRPGDVLVLYTDGIVESRNAKDEEYGYDRLLTSLEAHRHEDSDTLHASILEDLHSFLGGKSYDDDLTLVVLKWHGLPLGIDRAFPEREQGAFRARAAMQPVPVPQV